MYLLIQLIWQRNEETLPDEMYEISAGSLYMSVCDNKSESATP